MDIVDRLREMADLFEAQQAPHNLVLHLRTGADEIDRLRAGGCARDQGLTQHCAEAAGLTARVAELEGALKVIGYCRIIPMNLCKIRAVDGRSTP